MKQPITINTAVAEVDKKLHDKLDSMTTELSSKLGISKSEAIMLREMTNAAIDWQLTYYKQLQIGACYVIHDKYFAGIEDAALDRKLLYTDDYVLRLMPLCTTNWHDRLSTIAEQTDALRMQVLRIDNAGIHVLKVQPKHMWQALRSGMHEGYSMTRSCIVRTLRTISKQDFERRLSDCIYNIVHKFAVDMPVVQVLDESPTSCGHYDNFDPALQSTLTNGGRLSKIVHGSNGSIVELEDKAGWLTKYGRDNEGHWFDDHMNECNSKPTIDFLNHLLEHGTI